MEYAELNVDTIAQPPNTQNDEDGRVLNNRKLLLKLRILYIYICENN